MTGLRQLRIYTRNEIVQAARKKGLRVEMGGKHILIWVEGWPRPLAIHKGSKVNNRSEQLVAKRAVQMGIVDG